MLRVLCLDCICLVIGDGCFFIEVVSMLHMGETLLGLDLLIDSIRFGVHNVTHVDGWLC